MKWSEILKSSAGHHFVELDGHTPKAIKRLKEIKLFHYIEGLWSFRLGNILRIHGILDDGVLKVLWFARDHGATTTTKK
jgi:hypothetical protein